MVRQPDPARAVAFDALRAVRERDAFANLLLPVLLAERSISGRDAAFATELTNGSLRMRGAYDPVLAYASRRPVEDLDPLVLDVLRLGCHQLLWLRTAPHAAASTSVDLVRDRVGHRPVALVNAVLRRVAADDMPAWMRRVAPSYADDPVGNLAVGHSHPRWIVAAIRDALAGDLHATAAFLAADNRPAAVTLAARPGLSIPEELLRDGATRGSLSPLAVRLAGGSPAEIAAVREGRAGVQDEGSQVVALAAAHAPLAGSDARWLDLCAGPGGKAALLAAVGATRGATLVANELQASRSRLVRDAVRRLPARVVTGDGRRPPWRDGTFDRVLVDAPCSGLGALRRRPEARWRRTEAELSGLVDLQRALLGAALDSVRVGGVVAYATCSPHLAETTGVVAAVTTDRPDVEVLDARETCPGAGTSAGPYLQLWPHVHDTDAMFLALLRRAPGVRPRR